VTKAVSKAGFIEFAQISIEQLVSGDDRLNFFEDLGKARIPIENENGGSGITPS
jgi:hypothetical protein